MHHRIILGTVVNVLLGLQAICARNFTIAFTFEIKLTEGTCHTRETIVVTSDYISFKRLSKA